MNCEEHSFDVAPGCTSCVVDLLRGLLAVIHGDGGHHTEWVGIPKSVEDAKARVIRDRQDLDTATHALQK